MEPSSTSTTTGHPTLHRLLDRCRRNLGLLPFLVLTASLFVVSFGFIILRLVHPIHGPSISVASASVSAFNVSASSLSGIWDVSFDVRNTKTKVGASYQDVHASVYYKHAELSRTTLPSFHQGGRNETTVRTTLSAMGAYVDPSILNALNVARAASGSVDFTVDLTAKIKYKAPWWWMTSRYWDFECYKISVALPQNSNEGTLAGGSKECAAYRRHLFPLFWFLLYLVAAVTFGLILVGIGALIWERLH